MDFYDICYNILKERDRQDEMHRAGISRWDSHPYAKLAVLAEEFGEVAQACLHVDKENLREELIQVAAVCFAWLENIDFDPPTWETDGCR